MSKKKTILVIDDTEGILEAVDDILTLEGYSVMTAFDEDEAHKIITTKTKPNLILLDVLLSGQDGRIVATHLKKDKATQHIPIIMMSAHPDVVKTIDECGAEDFLAKPFEIEDLLKKIKKYI
jgi:DNA-binding response OmpR family regulator